MGWASNLLFTGLCFSIFGLWDNISLQLYNFISLLLDNVPLSVVEATLIFASGAAAFIALIAPLHCQKISTNTATRSQVRAQGRRRSSSGSFALCIVIALLIHYNYDPVRGEGSVMGMHDGRADAEASAKQHAEGPRKVFEPNQTLTPKNPKRNAVQKRSYRRALQRISKHGYTWYRGQLISGVKQPDASLTSLISSFSCESCPFTFFPKTKLERVFMELRRVDTGHMGPFSTMAHDPIIGHCPASGNALAVLQ